MLNQYSLHDIGIIVASIFIGMAFHEAMHAFVAHALGDQTAKLQGRLSLNPLRHVDLITTVVLPIGLLLVGLPPIFVARPVPINSNFLRYGDYGSALVALAGPFTNLALAALASLLIRFDGHPTGMFVYTLSIFMQVNIAFFVFNMIPLPPLDGSRLVYAFAPEPVRDVMDRLEGLGFFVTIMVLLLLSRFIAPVLVNINDAIFTFLLR